MISFPALHKVQMIKSSDWLQLCLECKVTNHTEWVYQGKSMSWYLEPSVHDSNYHRDFKSMITVRQKYFIWSQNNSPPYNINCVNIFFWRREFSLGIFFLDPLTIRWVTWIFLKFFKWWIMSWSPRIFASLFKKVPAVDHSLSKKYRDHILPLYCGMWTRRSLWNPQRRQNI